MELDAVCGIAFLGSLIRLRSLLNGQSAKGIDFLRPFVALQIRKTNRVARVKHHVIAT